LESSIDGASGAVFNITGGADMTLHEVNSAAEIIYEAVDPNANIIFGAVIDERVQGEVQITVIATGFNLESNTSQLDAARITPLKRTKFSLSTPTETAGGSGGLDIPEFLQRRRPTR
jgi:cell division protein FtsZ